MLSHRTRGKNYAFDLVFDENSTQIEVFDKTTKFLCNGLLDGFNSTVFSYGSTGAGKTHTMIGSPEQPGVMFNTMSHIFNLIKGNKNISIKISFLEIYNETIRDLIDPTDEVLDVREDPIKGISIAGLSMIEVKTANEVMSLLTLGNKNRIQEATGANQTSSRSHAVL